MPSKKSPAKEALGQWRAVPVKLPRKWHDVSPYARFIALEMFRRCDDDYQGVVAIAPLTYWMDDICRSLEIDGSHRPTGKAALQQLVDHRIVRVFDTYLFVDAGQKGALADACRSAEDFGPTSACGHTQLTPRSNRRQSQAKVRPKSDQTQPVESTEITSHRVGKERIGKERGGAGPQTAVPKASSITLFRPPTPDPDGFILATLANEDRAESKRPATLEETASGIWHRLFQNRWMTPHTATPADFARLVEWCKGSAWQPDGTRYDVVSIIRCVLWGFINDDYGFLCKKYHELKFLFESNRMTRYLHEFPVSIPNEYKPIQLSAGAAE